MRPRVGIVGYRGYSGAELVRILHHHGRVDPVLLEHRKDAEARPQPLNVPGPDVVPCSPEAVRFIRSQKRGSSWKRYYVVAWAIDLLTRQVHKHRWFPMGMYPGKKYFQNILSSL